MEVEFAGQTHTITFNLGADADCDANNNGILAFPNNHNRTIFIFGGTFANGRPASLERIRFNGFTLNGTQADLDALTGNETISFEPVSTGNIVITSSFQLGFNELPSTPTTEDFFEISHSGELTTCQAFTSNVLTPNSNLRIESLQFQLIPEPSTYALLAGALALLYRITRRSR